ncbi:MAG TPA: MBL fold metallo-hydrolase [bacterium]|jgi:glyoxylase-like metal-dependent hydrolase (beta-lactamase superfamily II)
MIELGPFRLDLISDGYFEDEADTFVRRCAEIHSAPRLNVRSKSRVRVGFNSLLIRGNGRTVVVDPGTGDKPRPDKVSAYTLQWPRQFFPALASLKVRPEDVDLVILTHLHWDHAGACTRLDAHADIVPSFPNARYVVQEREVTAARQDIAAGDLGSYMPDDFEPLLGMGRLELLNGDAHLLPGISVRWVNGHCAGLQTVQIAEAGSAGAIYLSDLIPTSAQIPLDCYLSYDHDIAHLTAEKERALAEAARRRDLLLFVHAPRLRAGYLLPRADGSYGLDSVTI